MKGEGLVDAEWGELIRVTEWEKGTEWVGSWKEGEGRG